MTYIPLLTDANGNAFVRDSNTDVFDTSVVTERTNTVIAQFIDTDINDVLDVTASGGASASAANGMALFSSSAATTSSLQAKTFNSIIYNPGFEIYGSFSVSWTTPTSAASRQLIGVWDITSNGFYLGYEGTTFGVGLMTGGSATFTARASWNGDPLDGTASSRFTRNGVPEAINFTFQNVFRIRYGWYGSSPILFEVFSPDGAWVVFHTIKHPNTAVTTSIQNPNLPLSLLISKTASDTTNLSMRSGSWTGGSTSPKTVDITNFREVTWTSLTTVNTAVEVSAVLAGSVSISIANTGTVSAGVVTFEKSPDGVVWFPLTVTDINSTPAIFTTRNLALGNFTTEAFIGGSYKMRVRLSTVITGAGSVNVMVRPATQAVARYIQVYQPDGTRLHTVVDSGTVSVTTSATGSAPAAASVGITSSQIVAANSARKGLVLTNTSNATVSFGLSGNAAVLNSGITLTPKGTWVMDQYTFTTGAITAIASNAASNVAIQELT